MKKRGEIYLMEDAQRKMHFSMNVWKVIQYIARIYLVKWRQCYYLMRKLSRSTYTGIS